MDNRLFQNLTRLSMISGYHALTKSDNAKLAAAIDGGLAAAILVTATWYFFVPRFWEAANSGKEIGDSFWLSWFPLVPEVLGAAVAGVCGYYLYGGATGWFSGKVRLLFLLGLGFVAVVMMGRVQMIQRLRAEQAGYLNRSVRYLETFGQRQQESLSALSDHEKMLSEILDKPDLGSEIKTATDDLRAQLQVELNTLVNLRLSGRQQAAEVESAQAHDFRGKGVTPADYVESLAKRKPGPELLGWPAGIDPLVRADGLVLEATMVEIAVVCLPAAR
jgi:hypothetical protein